MPSIDSKAVGSSLQRYHPVALAVSTLVFRDLSWHSIGLDEPHQSLKCKETFYSLMCSQIQLKVYLLYHNTKCFEARRELRTESKNKKTEGKKGWSQFFKFWSYKMREGKKNHIELTLTQERLNSPKRDNDHSFPPKGHRKISHGTEYLTRSFTNLLMSS